MVLARLRRCALIVALVVATAAEASSPAAASQPPSLRSYFQDSEAVRSGGVKLVPIKTPKGEFKVWTKRFGNNPRIKVLLLHGGPGVTHEYLESFEGFLPPEGIEFIYYDQLGSAYSDQPDYLYCGPSTASRTRWSRSAGARAPSRQLLPAGQLVGRNARRRVRAQVRTESQGAGHLQHDDEHSRLQPVRQRRAREGDGSGGGEEIRELEAKKEYENPRYEALLIPNFYAKHICRLPEWPDAVNRTFAKLNKKVYVLMQGPSEFGLTGRIEKWDRKADLPKLSVPTLVIGAKHDTMDPAHMKWVAGQVQNGSFLLCPNGSHFSMWDDQKTYFPGLVKWLKAVDAGRKQVTF